MRDGFIVDFHFLFFPSHPNTHTHTHTHRCGHTAKSEDLHGDRTLYELRRQYHCYAYNMLVAVISCTQNKPQFFLGFLFKEDLSKGQYLWDNIIDSEKDYQFQIELEVYSKIN